MEQNIDTNTNTNTNTYTNTLPPAALYPAADQRYKELVRLKKEVEARFQKAPSGKIHIVKSGTRIQFYLRTNPKDKSGKYIRKKDDKIIRMYLQKSYDEKILKLLITELKGLEMLINRYSSISKEIQQVYSGYSGIIKEYIDPVDISDEEFIQGWQDMPFQGKGMSDDSWLYETNRKEKVRSKSELTIANMLAGNGVPYKYECPLVLQNGTVIYPDFTILNVRKSKEIYWEHRGMMDDREYARKAVFKLKSMLKNGIVIGDNLYITEETSTNPLGTHEIETIIQKFCL